ncbi:ATP-binding cassette domain-containing protein [Alteromonas sp. C1M14]|uniref:ABC transporter ATP-binding protein n=1 Tax=Alteromonas sp. C1M14 TaxID=2841567 RepID=UPI001C098177|nr:ATP-binding cassette domain-containing protein [Alteromonas sp. C1M14]MBU2977346.1 ATP-binding cassette domain-containing protein [Alteromonas sp. C1M14]
MIEISQLKKKFVVANPKKLSEQERLDPRLQGKFFHSVRHVSFSCQGGEVLGLLGPNGAGKTTTLRMLSTALKPDDGRVMINGVDVLAQPVLVRKKIGFLSGNTGLYGRLSGRENMAYFGQLHGMQKQAIVKRIDELCELLDLHSFLDRRCETYSTGMKQKTAIARSVIHSPEVVILDEPTTGLDIMASQTVMEFIRQMKSQGVGVIFSTHHLDEVAQLCDRVAVINEGRTVFDDTLAVFCALAPGSLSQAFLSTLAQGGQ